MEGSNDPMQLDTRENRARLLKAGFTGKQIEEIYLIIKSFDVVNVNWQVQLQGLNENESKPSTDNGRYTGSMRRRKEHE